MFEKLEPETAYSPKNIFEARNEHLRLALDYLEYAQKVFGCMPLRSAAYETREAGRRDLSGELAKILIDAQLKLAIDEHISFEELGHLQAHFEYFKYQDLIPEPQYHDAAVALVETYNAVREQNALYAFRHDERGYKRMYESMAENYDKLGLSEKATSARAKGVDFVPREATDDYGNEIAARVREEIRERLKDYPFPSDVEVGKRIQDVREKIESQIVTNESEKARTEDRPTA